MLGWRKVWYTSSEIHATNSLHSTGEVAAIKQAMAGFSLPSSAMPSWAHAVPESVWKAELIGGLQKPKKSKKK